MQVLAQVEESGTLLHFAVSSFYTCTVSLYTLYTLYTMSRYSDIK